MAFSLENMSTVSSESGWSESFHSTLNKAIFSPGLSLALLLDTATHWRRVIWLVLKQRKNNVYITQRDTKLLVEFTFGQHKPNQTKPNKKTKLKKKKKTYALLTEKHQRAKPEVRVSRCHNIKFTSITCKTWHCIVWTALRCMGCMSGDLFLFCYLCM